MVNSGQVAKELCNRPQSEGPLWGLSGHVSKSDKWLKHGGKRSFATDARSISTFSKAATHEEAKPSVFAINLLAIPVVVAELLLSNKTCFCPLEVRFLLCRHSKDAQTANQLLAHNHQLSRTTRLS